MSQRVAIITGSSRGIGAATAIKAAEQGYHVCINYSGNQQAADAVATKVREHGAKAITVQGDMSQQADVLRLFDTVDNELGTLTLLVNNVGITTPMNPLVDTSMEDIKRLLDVNILSFMSCSQQAVKRMSTRLGGNGGCIVNVSSLAAKYGSTNTYLHYAASKGAMDSFTVGLSKEVGPEGIRVNAVRPGMIYTDIHAVTGDASRVDKAADRIPLRRGGQPEEIASAIMWLASQEASYVDGALLDVGGGL